MNDILKKRFRKIIRKHFEARFQKGYETTKQMYWLMGFIDSVMDDIEVYDLVPFEDIERIKVVNDLLIKFDSVDIFSKQLYYPIISRDKKIGMIVRFEPFK